MVANIIKLFIVIIIFAIYSLLLTNLNHFQLDILLGIITIILGVVVEWSKIKFIPLNSNPSRVILALFLVLLIFLLLVPIDIYDIVYGLFRMDGLQQYFDEIRYICLLILTIFLIRVLSKRVEP